MSSGDDSDESVDHAEDFYNDWEDIERQLIDVSKDDPDEHFQFVCLTVSEVESLLKERVDLLSSSLEIKGEFAKILLFTYNWDIDVITYKYQQDANKLLTDSRILPINALEKSHVATSAETAECMVCLQSVHNDFFYALTCGHHFCHDCWNYHLETNLLQGISTGVECMGHNCSIVVPEDFALRILIVSDMREKYQQLAFTDYVSRNPMLRYCPGPNCSRIVYCKGLQRKPVTCSECKTTFCFKCGGSYHAPMDCETTKRWLTTCLDDSKTALYFSVYTKDCPKCKVCIEKNGGCNHMQCQKCAFDFCWVCLRDWSKHTGYTSQCNQYIDNPENAKESRSTAREALKRYLFYYDRWMNHANSLSLEEELLSRIKDRINQKVLSNEGTWIDWQYLLNAASLLTKCRYTLQYTYPHAYYLESGPQKELFEYQQAQLETEVENLSWKVERAETTDRGDLQNQMDIAEKRRTALLKGFLSV